MKITKNYLKQIIKEELTKLNENVDVEKIKQEVYRMLPSEVFDTLPDERINKRIETALENDPDIDAEGIVFEYFGKFLK